ncbi:hypothetical protein V8E51_005643 [Hyaloscypha variabilis]|jgi:hypothetical protein|uniref:Uncharacterized protein n=1 Tax=Hyaloscypha variabilis (strain UAMH 11265 / GT02V1 / F) TaxID=1149755 RepID=A0A2J6S3I5_HYAVF|nr:hypothetical protein L207DRAFT_253254 [Hyaloscypha variabilis F]
MANPFHLADRALTPIISSSRPASSNNHNHNLQSHAQAQALSSLTSTAITAFDTASRLGLGLQRIMIETQSSGPIILHSFLSTPSLQQAPAPLEDHNGVRGIVEQAREDLRPLSGTTDTESMGEHVTSSGVLVNGVPESAEDADQSSVQLPPMLIATVVARAAAHVGDARRAAARLEQTGRIVQREWIRENEESVVADGEGG